MTITPAAIADAIYDAPAWALLALSTRSETLREDARQTLGEHVYRTLVEPVYDDRNQLALPL